MVVQINDYKRRLTVCFKRGESCGAAVAAGVEGEEEDLLLNKENTKRENGIKIQNGKDPKTVSQRHHHQ